MKELTLKGLTSVLFLFAAACLTSIAHAIPITVELTGYVTDWDGSLGAQFTAGDALTATYSYDSDTAAILSGTYALTDFSGTLGSYAFNTSGDRYSLIDNSTFGDQIHVYGTSTSAGANVGDAVLAGPYAYFRDYDATFFSGVNQLLIAPDLSVMEQYQFALAFDSTSGGRVLVRADISTASLVDSGLNPNSVPEPATLLLFGTGIAGLVGVVRRKKK